MAAPNVLPSARSAQWKQLPITVTAWSYGFGTLAMGLASVYYYSQPEEFVMPASVSARMPLQHSTGNHRPPFSNPGLVCTGLRCVHHVSTMLLAPDVVQSPHCFLCGHCLLATSGQLTPLSTAWANVPTYPPPPKVPVTLLSSFLVLG